MTNNEMPYDKLVVDLPRKEWSLLSHVKNIEYVIEKLEGCRGGMVVGCRIIRGFGNKEDNYEFLSHEEAKRLAEENKRFRFYTLKKLVDERQAYVEGRYKVKDGHFVGLL
jgi:hypothetical protein